MIEQNKQNYRYSRLNKPNGQPSNKADHEIRPKPSKFSDEKLQQ